MKKFKELEKQKSTRDKELLKKIEYEELRRGLYKTKDDYEEQKAKRYVKNINAYYEMFIPYKHIEITEGSKKEGRHTYPTKSQLDWKNDYATKYIFVKKNKQSAKTGNIYQTVYKYRLNIETTNPELLYIKKSLEEKIYIPPRKEKVLLIINNFMFYKEMKIEPNELSFYSSIKRKNRNINLYVEKHFPEKNEEFKTIYGKMTGEEILKILLKTKVKMYKGYLKNEIEESII